jgi:hypothetical protein
MAYSASLCQRNSAPTPYFYVPIRQIYRPEMGLIFYARTSDSIPNAITALRREARTQPFLSSTLCR